MALSLTEAAKLLQNDLQRGVVETIIEDAPLLQMLPFQEVAGNAYAYTQENALPAVGFRAVNAAYTEAAGTFTSKTETLAILGGDVDVDRYIIRTRPGEVADQRAEQTRMKSKAVRRAFQDAFINGLSGSNEFDGLKTRLATLTAQDLAAGTNGLAIVGADDAARHSFLDKLDELISLVPGGPDIFLCNGNVLAKFKSSARRLTIYDETKDAFGKPVATYAGIPVVDIGEDEAGNEILPQTETQGTAAGICSSIYAVRFGRTPEERGTTGLTNGMVQVYDLGEIDDKPAFRTRIEFYCGLAVHGDASFARLKGVLAS